MRLPRNFLKPLAIGAPAPFREMPLRAERMVYFLPPHLEKIRARIPESIRMCNVLCGNLEDAIPIEDKAAARAGFIEVANANLFGDTALWVRVNCLSSPWILDDLEQIVRTPATRWMCS